MTISLEGAVGFLLVMFRMTGLLVFHPILGRRNIPTMLNAGFAFVLAIVITPTLETAGLGDPALFTFLLLAFKEFAVGFVAGMLMQMILAVLVVGGETVDMMMGISMSKAFDPATNSSISVSAQTFNIMFVLIFFSTNNHLTLIHLTAQTFGVIPLGGFAVNPQFYSLLPQLFSTMLVFAMKLALPVVVVEIIVTFAVGIIMRIIPQINVFVVSIQFKLLVGILVVMLLVPSFCGFFENLIIIGTENLVEVWQQFAA